MDGPDAFALVTLQNSARSMPGVMLHVLFGFFEASVQCACQWPAPESRRPRTIISDRFDRCLFIGRCAIAN